MKTLNTKRLISLILVQLLIIVIAMPVMSVAAVQPTVDLGTTSSFAILAGTTITNTGPTTINGDAGGNVGVAPGTSVTGFPPGIVSNGAITTAAAVTTAKTDLVAAYNDAAGRTGALDLSDQDLAGMTLTPGVYNFSSSAQLTGTLTLDGQNQADPVFIFQIGSTLTTASDSDIELINGARYCRTFWQVGSSATLGTNSNFVGHIFALTSIAAQTGATVQGQLLARNGEVTLDSNTIMNGFCADSSATLTVIKHVINDNGRTAVAGDFNIHVTLSGSEITSSPAVGVELPGRTYTLGAGLYVISEDVSAGYAVSYSGDSDAFGNVTLGVGDTATVTITNNDTPISSGGGSGGGSSTVSSPLINVTKTPSPLALTSGAGLVTYTYKVSNPGNVSLHNVRVTDDKVSPVTYISGDANNDDLLQVSETWVYTSSTNLAATTTNIVTARGSSGGTTVTDTATAIVVVSSPAAIVPIDPATPPAQATPVAITTTVTGGQLPDTATPWYSILLFGAVLTIIGAVGWKSRKRYE